MTSRRPLLLLSLLWLLSGNGAEAGRVVAVGDIHGEIDGFDSVLRAAALIDAEGRWVGGDAILVQTGDLTDRGPRVRPVMDRLRALEQQAPAQGGRVVALLGNHEIGNLISYFDDHSTPAEVYERIWGDFADDQSERRRREAYKSWRRWQWRFPACGVLDKKAWMQSHPPGYLEYVEALSPDGDYGRWLRGLPIAAVVEDSVFLHGGLSPELLAMGIDSIAELNRRAADDLRQFDADRASLLEDQIALPFSTLPELYCALSYRIAKLTASDSSADAERLPPLQAILDRMPATTGWLLSDESGPVWYRGAARWHDPDDEPQLRQVLKAFGVRRMVVGHTPTPGQIQARFGGQLFLIDTAMVYGPEVGGRGSALELNGGSAVAIYADGREILIEEPVATEATNGHDHDSEGAGEETAAVESSNGQEAETAAAAPPAADGVGWLDPDRNPLPLRTDEEILEFLREARIVSSEEVGSGVTHPEKLLLERDGVRAHAIFHDINVEKQRQRLAGGKVVMFFRDSYANNVAAFELSRELGLHNVPPAVVRSYRGRDGSVQMWIEGGQDEAKRRLIGFTPPGNWRLTWDDMWVFDNLINNIDRNQGNILYDSGWRLWFIDHTRAFGRGRQLPEPKRVKRVSRRLWQALHDLEEERLSEVLRPYLGPYEIAGLMARCDALIKLIEKRIAEQGESAVLQSYDQPPVVVSSSDADDEIPPAPPGR